MIDFLDTEEEIAEKIIHEMFLCGIEADLITSINCAIKKVEGMIQVCPHGFDGRLFKLEKVLEILKNK